ncbi:hypothetical protein Tco_0777164 [Tanacetum coccineum]
MRCRSLKDRNTGLEKEKDKLDVKVANLAASVKVHRLETSSAGLQENVTVYENSMSQLKNKAIEKGMQDELAARITHGQEGRVLTDDFLQALLHSDTDQTVIGYRALSLSLDVSHGRVQRIRENIVNNRPALHDVFVLFSEPFSIVALGGTEGTSSVAPETTTALILLLRVCASSIPFQFSSNK